jgi:prepilin-type N-terminal cleavage/methylation domain-containing protein
MAMRGRRNGYTLFELILVLAILAIIGAIVAPNLGLMFSTTKVSAAADMVRARWADGKSRAQEEGRPYKFAVQIETGKFRIAPDSPEYWNGGAKGDSKTLVLEDELPKDVIFAQGQNSGSNAQGSGEWSHAVVFNPDGTASDDYNICFNAQGCRPVELRLRGATGSVTETNPDQ